MTNYRRISVMITPEIENQIMAMRKTDEYCRLSISEIIRILIRRGLDEKTA